MGILHNINATVGHTLHALRAGEQKIAIHDGRLATDRAIRVHSADFQAGATLPQRLTADGQGSAPALDWSGVPEGTRELVLICEDPDAPMPKPFVHWIVYGIPPTLHDVPAGLEADAVPRSGEPLKQGTNSMHRVGYTPAAPPARHGVHHYHFQVFALDRSLHMPASPDRDALLDAMAGHVLASGEVVGTYERR